MMKWLRVCAACSYSLPPIDLFCEHCWLKLSDKILMVPKIDSKQVPFPLTYLWDWRMEDEEIEQLIYGLKHAKLPEAHERLVGWILQRNSDLYDELEKPTAIVFPTKDIHKKDHAYYLAHALSQQLKIPAHPMLIAANQKSYRTLGRKERYRERQIEGAKITGQRLLFVDDVLTTGATAYRAWQALGEIEGFRACVLVYKNLLRNTHLIS